MLACVSCCMLWINNWQVQNFCTLDSLRTAVKTTELAPLKNILFFQITDSQYSWTNNSFAFLKSIHCKHRQYNYNYAQQFLLNTSIRSILTLFTSCKHVGINIIEQWWILKFSQSVCDLQMLRAWNVIPRVLHDFTLG